MARIERATEKQVASLVKRGCQEDRARSLSAEGAWELLKECMKQEGTWQPYTPPEKKKKPKNRVKRKPKPNPAARIMPFGKHKGKRLSSIPRSYLEWMVSEFEKGDSLRAAAQQVLDGWNRQRKVDRKRKRRRAEPVVYKTHMPVLVDPSLPAPWEGPDEFAASDTVD